MATLSRLSLSSLSALLVAAPAISVPLRAELPQARPDFSRFAATTEQRTIPVDIDDQNRITLQGNVHAALRDAREIGMTDPSLPMERMILTFKMAPDAQYRLDALLAAQQDPKSPYYHQWVSPEEFGKMFGPSQADVDTVTTWLLGMGFQIDDIAPGRMTLNFSGSVAKVQNAFRTSIRDFEINGVKRHANAEDPSIPAALGNVVAGIVSLHNIPRRNYSQGFHALSPQDAAAVRRRHQKGIISDWKGTANGTAGVYMAPSDWATMYDANSTYSSNGKGSGATIGIVGRTNPGTTNWATFRSTLGLPVNTPTIIVNGTNPGDLGSGEDGEADLDAEWSGGTAPLATVKFVASASTSSTDGVDLSAQYIVNNNLTDVMSTSFGQCESSMGSTENTFYNNLWSQAASEGITSFVSTGDSGPAGCAAGSATSGSGQSGVNGLASTPYNVAVGATQPSNSSSYWNTSGAAISYIPETPWNESGTVSGGSGLWSTSSGASSTYAKPSWQVAPGVPSTSHRYLPDVSLDGSDMFFGNYGMLVYSQGAMGTTGGTSAASPSWAGVMALVVAKYGRQGNANTKFYQLGNAQYASGGTAVFHDITSGNNNVPGLTGFTASAGWDEVTGLGTPDVTVLVNNWNGTSTTNTVTASITTPSGNVTLASGASQSFVGTGTDSASGQTLTYGWAFGDGSTGSGASTSHTYTNTGSSAVTYTATLTVTDTTGAKGTATRTITVNPASTGGTQLVTNGGFESGATGWNQTSGVIGANGPSEPAHTGTYDAWLDGYGTTHTDYITQSIAVPAAGATLSFWLHIDTAETTTTTAYDTLKVQVLNASGTVLGTLATFSNLNAASGYTQHSYSLSAYAGQTVTIKFLGAEDSSLQTSFVIDDVSAK